MGETKAGQRGVCRDARGHRRKPRPHSSEVEGTRTGQEHHRDIHGGQRGHVRIEPVPRNQSSEELSGQPLCVLQPSLAGSQGLELRGWNTRAFGRSLAWPY